MWGHPDDGVPLVFLTFSCSYWASSNMSVTVAASLLQTSSLGGGDCCSRKFWVSFISLSCLSSCALWPYLCDKSKKNCWFFSCSTFYLLGWIGDFSSYMLDWKLEVLNIFQELIFASVDFFFLYCLSLFYFIDFFTYCYYFLPSVLLASLDGNLYHCFIFYSYNCF